jgi:hypothetical protein
MVWMRFMLAYDGAERGDIEFILSLKGFPAIPGFREVQKRIRATGSLKNIVTFEAAWPQVKPGSLPPDLQSKAVISLDESKGVSSVPAYPPWIRPNHRWEILPHDHDLFNYPPRPWAETVEAVFAAGERRRQEIARAAKLLEREQFNAVAKTEKERQEAAAKQQEQDAVVYLQERSW